MGNTSLSCPIFLVVSSLSPHLPPPFSSTLPQASYLPRTAIGKKIKRTYPSFSRLSPRCLVLYTPPRTPPFKLYFMFLPDVRGAVKDYAALIVVPDVCSPFSTPVPSFQFLFSSFKNPWPFFSTPRNSSFFQMVGSCFFFFLFCFLSFPQLCRS